MSQTIVHEEKSSPSQLQYTDVFNEILNVDVKKCSVALFMASVVKDEPIPAFERIQITTKLADSFREVIASLQVVYRSDLQKDDLLFPEYAQESDPDDYQIEHFDLSTPTYGTILEQITPLSSSADIELFDEKDRRFVDGLRFYVIALQPEEGESIYFFRAYTHSRILLHSFFMSIGINKLYDHVSVFPCQFDGDIDCMCRGKVMFILKKDNFQRIFRFFEEVRKSAKETLEDINMRIPIHNFEEFTKACEGDVRKLRKLRTIASKSYLKDVPFDTLKKAIKMLNLSIQVVEIDGKEHLVYDPKAKDKWELLRLLNDDYLKSLLTEQKYEVTSKREL